MTLIHGLARTFIAPMFIAGGVDCVKHPESKAKNAEKVTGGLITKLNSLGLPEDPAQLVRINGGLQLVAGSLLALGRMPRLASAAQRPPVPSRPPQQLSATAPSVNQVSASRLSQVLTRATCGSASSRLSRSQIPLSATPLSPWRSNNEPSKREAKEHGYEVAKRP